jgi:2-phosphosulfolactate phosphatase
VIPNSSTSDIIVRPLFVHFLPELMDAHGLPTGMAVVIDILRASSTIVTALRNGASSVHPCASAAEARLIRTGEPAATVLLGGERHGVRMEGFDLGNSPAEYTPEVVAGRTIAFTTTNGTRALLACGRSSRILIGCFLNLSALVSRLMETDVPVHLLCAGTDGLITGEDVLFAGAVVRRLTDDSSHRLHQRVAWQLNDCAEIALSHWCSVEQCMATRNSTAEDVVAQRFRTARGGVNLLELGYDSDLVLCSRIDTTDVVPEFDHASSRLVRHKRHIV